MGKPVKALTGGVLGSVLGGGDTRGQAPAAPPPPPPPAEAPVPMADDEASRKARKRQVSKAQSRSGRASTILTDFSGDSLGG